MKSVLFFLSMILVLASCQTELTKDFSFLEGSWKMETSDSTYLLESWEKISDTKYTALNYAVSDTGMQLTEEIEIEIGANGTFYKPTILGLNNDEPFMYRFISHDENKFVFENKEYDFPRKIWYKIIDANSLQAGIENESGEQKETFIFERVEEEK